MFKKTLVVIGVLFFITCIAIFRPVPIVSEDKAITQVGTVTDIYEGGDFDVVFLIKETPKRYYINRGLESGLLTLDKLKQELIGQQVTFKYPPYWTPLDWDNNIRHLSKVEFDGRVIFNELKPSRS